MPPKKLDFMAHASLFRSLFCFLVCRQRFRFAANVFSQPCCELFPVALKMRTP